MNKIFKELENKLKMARPLYKNGACGLVALCIGKYLKKNNINFEVVIFSFKKWAYIHVMIKIPNRQSYIDRRGFTNGLFYRIMPYKVRTVSIEELEKLVDDKSLWRKKFDRSLESEIRKIIS